jgi:hypothetical protein
MVRAGRMNFMLKLLVWINRLDLSNDLDDETAG